jgi:uncharacterized membrane protein
MSTFLNELSTTGDTEDRRFKPVEDTIFPSASPVSSVVEMFVLHRALGARSTFARSVKTYAGSAS